MKKIVFIWFFIILFFHPCLPNLKGKEIDPKPFPILPPMYFLEITGPTGAYVGNTTTYTANWTDSWGNPISAPSSSNYTWSATGGTVTWQGMTSCNVQWTSTGTNSVELDYYTFGNWYYDNISVNVIANPVAIAANTFTSTSFTANWNSSSGATSYRLDVATDSGFGSMVSGYSNLTVSSTSKNVTGLNAGTTYYYRVRAISSIGTSGNSNVITTYTIPNAPGIGLASSITTTSFVANWNSVTGATGYRLDVSTSIGFSSFVSGYNNLSVGTTSQNVTNLTGGTTYYYRVRAENTSGSSANSGSAEVTTVPAAPTANAASDIATTSFTANWGSASTATAYLLDVSEQSDFSTFVPGYNGRPVFGTSQAVTGLTGGTTYRYRVRALNSSGTSSSSNVITTLSIPAAPQLNGPSSVSTTSFTINWGSVTSATGYRLDVSTDSTFASFLAGYDNLTVSTTSRNVTGLTAGTVYYYRVRAVNASGTSPNSAMKDTPTKPLAPTANNATSIVTTSFVANWASATGATGYRLDVSTSGSFASYVPGYNNLAVLSTSYTVTGLSANTSYHYRIRGENSSGISANSVTISLTTTQTYPNHDQNFVKTIVSQKAGVTSITQLESAPLSDKQVTFGFFDGLGRPLQTVGVQQSPDQYDIVQPVEYDAVGREAVKYLPYVSGNDGSYKMNFLGKSHEDYSTISNAQYWFYQTTAKVASDTVPYSEILFEPSPLHRPDKEFGPGEDWRNNNKSIRHKFQENIHGTGTDQEIIIAWKVSSNLPVRSAVVSGAIVTGGYYATGQLSIKSTRDEQGNEVREYLDKEGKVLLKKVQAVPTSTPVSLSNRAHWAQTYYVYDSLGNLRFVIPPVLSHTIHQSDVYNPSSTEVDNLAFQYKYDNRKRMTEKRVPGAQSVYMVYDKRDRLIMTQDGNQRAGATGAIKYWTFTKYDDLNRPILTGIKDTTTTAQLTQAQMQAVVDAHFAKTASAWGERYIGNATGNIHGYTNKAYPTCTGSTAGEKDPNKYLTVTYYDNYSFRSLWTGDYTYLDENLSESVNGTNYSQPDAEFTRIAGQVTGTKIKVLDGGMTGGYTWLKSVNYYDDRYRFAQVVSDNYKGGTDRVTNVYDFTGKVLKSKTTYEKRDVEWRDRVGVAVVGNKLVRTATSTAGAASVQKLPASQDGWLEVVVSETNTNRYIGFNDSNPDVSSANIDYAFYLNSSTLRIYESNSLKHTASGSLVPGEVLRIERTGSTVKYYRNGVQLPYTKTGALTSDLYVDVSLLSNNASLVGVRTSFNLASNEILRTFKYDHAGRLLETWHKLNTDNAVLLAGNEYNELGELIDKKLHSTNGTSFRQSVDYRYNIRGWLTKINESDLSGGDSGDPADFFGMQLAYQDDLGAGNTTDKLQYNGNINAIKWSTNLGLGTSNQLAYNFSYDVLNRLQHASHRSYNSSTWSDGNYSENNLSYDMNGNILGLQRTGDGGATIDNLTYNYGSGTAYSNKLLYVSDGVANAADKAKGFKDGNTGTATDYTYDANGNMTRDLNKGIGLTTGDNTYLITYNFMNLPQLVKRVGNQTQYIYDATGRKLANVTSFSNAQKQSEYLGELMYENDALQYIQHEEGRIVLQETELIYTSDASSASDFTPSTNFTTTPQTINGEKYVKVTPNVSITLTKLGTTPIGGTFQVTAGEKYVYRVKGYSNSTKIVYLYVKGNSADIVWTGASLPVNAKGEMWVETAFVVPTGVTQITLGALYSAGTSTSSDYFYINDVELKKILTLTPEYQYHLKDHLGNVRLTFTTKYEVESDSATLEAATMDDERAEFLRYDDAKRIQATLFNRTNGTSTAYSQRLNGTTNEIYGLAKSLSVMPGDTVSMEVYAKYVDTNSNNWNTALTNLMGQIAANAVGVVYEGSTYSTSTSSFPHEGVLNTSGSSGGPKAYLNYLFFDRNFAFKNGGYKRLSAAPKETGQDVAHERLFFDNLVITEAGYLYIYLSNENETPVEVFFDDFKVEHIQSPVVQADDYYPGGLTFNSYNRENSVENKNLYQSKEWQDELDLNLYDFEWRQYDPTIWRTPTIDPLAEEFYDQSPYSWAGNNPILNIDPDGQDWYSFTNEDGKQTTIWQKGDAKEVEIDGTKYQNIGTSYKQTLDDGTLVYYEQNEVMNVVEDPDKPVGEKPLEHDKGLKVTEVSERTNKEINNEIKNFTLSFIPEAIREIFGVQVDEEKTTAPDGLFPVKPKPPGTSGSDNGLHKPKKQSTGKAKKGRHQAGEARYQRDQGGEKGDASRNPPRKRPPGHKGPWPPKN
jgi:RHS repeat-associated protein